MSDLSNASDTIDDLDVMDEFFRCTQDDVETLKNHLAELTPDSPIDLTLQEQISARFSSLKCCAELIELNTLSEKISAAEKTFVGVGQAGTAPSKATLESLFEQLLTIENELEKLKHHGQPPSDSSNTKDQTSKSFSAENSTNPMSTTEGNTRPSQDVKLSEKRVRVVSFELGHSEQYTLNYDASMTVDTIKAYQIKLIQGHLIAVYSGEIVPLIQVGLALGLPDISTDGKATLEILRCEAFLGFGILTKKINLAAEIDNTKTYIRRSAEQSPYCSGIAVLDNKPAIHLNIDALIENFMVDKS